MEIKDGFKSIEIPEEKIKELSSLGRARGLMFRKREKSKILLFNFNKLTREPIHSFFVFFPFLAVWIDEENNIIEKKIIHPWKRFVVPSRKFKKLIEIPFNSNSEEVIKKILSLSTEIRKI